MFTEASQVAAYPLLLLNAKLLLASSRLRLLPDQVCPGLRWQPRAYLHCKDIYMFKWHEQPDSPYPVQQQ